MNQTWKHFLENYGMLFVLLALCLALTFATLKPRPVEGGAAGRPAAAELAKSLAPNSRVLVVAANGDQEQNFADAAELLLTEQGHEVVKVTGDPGALGKRLRELQAAGTLPAGVVHSFKVAKDWDLLDNHAVTRDLPKTAPVPRTRSTFLSVDNLLTVMDQTAIIAIVAIGMTLVIITAGIDLSVGSLIALAAVLMAMVIRAGGGEEASVMYVVLGGFTAIVISGLVGLFNGAMVAFFKVPAFIVTLAMMLSIRGFARQLTNGNPISDVPDSINWLGRGKLFGVMSRTVFGRHIYAVGGNEEAARLSGVNVKKTLLAAYFICGLGAGLGGVINASLFESGDPNFAPMYELYVIAAVVVGGTSLMGGRGKIFGTLIGAMIIAVIGNGMNLKGIPGFTQEILLGFVILAAVLFDQTKAQTLGFLRGLLPGRATTKAT